MSVQPPVNALQGQGRPGLPRPPLPTHAPRVAQLGGRIGVGGAGEGGALALEEDVVGVFVGGDGQGDVRGVVDVDAVDRCRNVLGKKY